MVGYDRHPLWDVLNAGQPYVPLDWQAEHIHARPDCPRIIACCGRRAGKTTAVRAEIIREALKPDVRVGGVLYHPKIYIVAPNYELTTRVFQPIWDDFVGSDMADQHPIFGDLLQYKDKVRKLLVLKNGATIQAKSADEPKSLQGERVTFAVVEEAHDVSEDAWREFMPALADAPGRMIAIGKPKGRGRFRSYFFRGQLGEERFYSCSVPSFANPWLDRDELEAEADDLTEREYKSEILAEWGDEDGAVFSHVDHIFTGEERPPGQAPTIMGLDVAKKGDYTWAMVGEVGSQDVIAGERFTGLDYTIQVPRIARLYHDYGCRFIHMDTNGAGEAVADFLRAEGCSIVPFSWGNSMANKAAMVGVLAREIERGSFTVPSSWEILKRELQEFEGTVMPSGIRYEAAAGYHDDGVIALALLMMKLVKNKGMAKSPVVRRSASFGRSSSGLRLPPLPKPKVAV